MVGRMSTAILTLFLCHQYHGIVGAMDVLVLVSCGPRFDRGLRHV
jgi:hypothetical protein